MASWNKTSIQYGDKTAKSRVYLGKTAYTTPVASTRQTPFGQMDLFNFDNVLPEDFIFIKTSFDNKMVLPCIVLETTDEEIRCCPFRRRMFFEIRGDQRVKHDVDIGYQFLINRHGDIMNPAKANDGKPRENTPAYHGFYIHRHLRMWQPFFKLELGLEVLVIHGGIENDGTVISESDGIFSIMFAVEMASPAGKYSCVWEYDEFGNFIWDREAEALSLAIKYQRVPRYSNGFSAVINYLHVKEDEEANEKNSYLRWLDDVRTENTERLFYNFRRDLD